MMIHHASRKIMIWLWTNTSQALLLGAERNYAKGEHIVIEMLHVEIKVVVKAPTYGRWRTSKFNSEGLFSSLSNSRKSHLNLFLSLDSLSRSSQFLSKQQSTKFGRSLLLLQVH